MEQSFYTQLDIDECKSRIDEAIDKKKGWFYYSSGMVGKINKDRFWLKKNKKDWIHSCARMFDGKLIIQDHGTVIKGKFRLHTFAKVFMYFWFGFLAFGEILFSLGYIFRLGNFRDNSSWIGFVTPLAMMIFGIFFVKSGTWFWQSEEKFVIDFIKTTLEAEETPILAKTNI